MKVTEAALPWLCFWAPWARSHRLRAGLPQNDHAVLWVLLPRAGAVRLELKGNPRGAQATQDSPSVLGLVTGDVAQPFCADSVARTGDNPGTAAVTSSAHAAAVPLTLGQNDCSGPQGGT